MRKVIILLAALVMTAGLLISEGFAAGNIATHTAAPVFDATAVDQMVPHPMVDGYQHPPMPADAAMNGDYRHCSTMKKKTGLIQ